MYDQKALDALLVLEYRSGDRNALTSLVNRYQQRFCRHAYWYTHDISASKDIVQDCWHQIINKLGELRDPNSFGSWAMRIVTRKSLDYLKKYANDRKNLEIVRREFIIDSPQDYRSTQLKNLSKTIRELPNDQQMVLKLFYTEDYSLKEISDILEISVGTVKSRLFHAREKLKAILKTIS